MESTLKIKRESTIKNASMGDASSGGRFYVLANQDILLTYTHQVQMLNLRGRLAIIKRKQVSDLFETKDTLCEPLLVGNDEIYLTTFGNIDAATWTSPPSRVVRLDISGKVIWEYTLEGSNSCLPLYAEDSVFICDYQSNKQVGSLYKISKTGQLVWKKQFPGSSWNDIYLLEERNLIIVGISNNQTLYVLDLDGHILIEKEMQPAFNPQRIFSRGINGQLFVNADSMLFNLDKNMDIIWKYKQEINQVICAPAVGSDGNLYIYLSGCNLVCLDPLGKEIWNVRTAGDWGTMPIVLEDGNILTVTSGQGIGSATRNEWRTCLQVFSPQGKLLTNHEFPGWVEYCAKANNSQIYLATNDGNLVKGIRLYILTFQ